MPNQMLRHNRNRYKFMLHAKKANKTYVMCESMQGDWVTENWNLGTEGVCNVVKLHQ